MSTTKTKPAVTVKEEVPIQPKIIVVLEKAPLEVAFIKKQHILLNSDDHQNYISNKLHKDPAQYRPDITHQCLLTLLDSPLNKAGLLQVYVTTASNQVIRVHPATRIPRTFKRFASLFAQLLKKMTIRAEESSVPLLEVIKSPVSKHLPSEAPKIAMSTQATLVNFGQYSSRFDIDKPIVISVGAVAKGNPTMDVDYITDSTCISRYSLSASVCLSRILHTFEERFDIL